MNKNEERLIFGDLLEDISDIVVMDEASSSLMAAVHSKVAANDAQKVKNDVAKGKASVYDANQAEMRAKQVKYEATKVINRNRNQKQDDIAGSSNKDDVSGVIKEAVSQAELNAQRKIDSVNAQIDRVQASADRRKENLERQKDTARRNLEIARARNSKDNSNVGTTDEANRQSLTEAYSDMFYNGVYGDVLRYLILGEINNKNKDVIEIAKKLSDDKEAMFYIKSIKAILNREAKKRSRPEDYTNLKVYKSKLKSRYIKIKKI